MNLTINGTASVSLTISNQRPDTSVQNSKMKIVNLNIGGVGVECVLRNFVLGSVRKQNAHPGRISLVSVGCKKTAHTKAGFVKFLITTSSSQFYIYVHKGVLSNFLAAFALAILKGD